MQRTPLFTQHQACGGKLVDFAGWEMPIQYGSVVDEYQTVRTKAGLFDVSHMGRIWVEGSGAVPFLQRVTTNDVGTLAVSQAHYSMVCNERGGIKDDIFVYRLAADEYMLCVNASNREKIFAWLQSHHTSKDQCRLDDRSGAISQVAVQGPKSRELLISLGAKAVEQLKMHHSSRVTVGGITCLAARTGYSGELGFELYADAQTVGRLWELLVEKGQPYGLKPAGLGARDLLRLEMGYLLYGNDINEEITPIEAGADWTVKFQKGDFVGRDRLLPQQQTGPTKRFIAFELIEKAVPRHGFRILDAANGQYLGDVTSGNLSPLLQKGIGLGYVPVSHGTAGSALAVEIRGKTVPAVVVKPPFYKRKA